jgi:hypothetical protein
MSLYSSLPTAWSRKWPDANCLNPTFRASTSCPPRSPLEQPVWRQSRNLHRRHACRESRLHRLPQRRTCRRDGSLLVKNSTCFDIHPRNQWCYFRQLWFRVFPLPYGRLRRRCGQWQLRRCRFKAELDRSFDA